MSCLQDWTYHHPSLPHGGELDAAPHHVLTELLCDPFSILGNWSIFRSWLRQVAARLFPFNVGPRQMLTNEKLKICACCTARSRTDVTESRKADTAITF
jgi:hypothetical protein